MLMAALIAITGCASTPMASKEQDAASKTFKAPSPDMAGIYIYRNSSLGKALLKTVSIDKNIIGSTAANTFFHRETSPGEHTLATQSEFSDNQLQINTEAGKNYFIHQYIKLGVFVGGANLESVTDAEGQKGVLECNEALSLTVTNAPSTEPVAASDAQTNAASKTGASANETVSQKLRDLQALRTDGVITEDEFQKKKQQLLEKL